MVRFVLGLAIIIALSSQLSAHSWPRATSYTTRSPALKTFTQNFAHQSPTSYGSGQRLSYPTFHPTYSPVKINPGSFSPHNAHSQYGWRPHVTRTPTLKLPTNLGPPPKLHRRQGASVGRPVHRAQPINLQPIHIQPIVLQPQFVHPPVVQPHFIQPQFVYPPLVQGYQPYGHSSFPNPQYGQRTLTMPTFVRPPAVNTGVPQQPGGQQPVGQLPFGQLPVGQPPVGQPLVGQSSVGQPSVVQPLAGQSSTIQPPVNIPQPATHSTSSPSSDRKDSSERKEPQGTAPCEQGLKRNPSTDKCEPDEEVSRLMAEIFD